MFTGIIEGIGTIFSVRRMGGCTRLVVAAENICKDLKIGESVGVDGVCLTVVGVDAPRISFDVMPETLKASTLKSTGPGVRVNLERAMKADGRFGGHLVSGHVDGVGTIRSKKTGVGQITLVIAVSPAILAYIFPKGSVAVDGVSLTVFEKKGGAFSVCLIPHSAQMTTLGRKSSGSRVNVEVDMVVRIAVDVGKRHEDSKKNF